MARQRTEVGIAALRLERDARRRPAVEDSLAPDVELLEHDVVHHQLAVDHGDANVLAGTCPQGRVAHAVDLAADATVAERRGFERVPTIERRGGLEGLAREVTAVRCHEGHRHDKAERDAGASCHGIPPRPFGRRGGEAGSVLLRREREQAVGRKPVEPGPEMRGKRNERGRVRIGSRRLARLRGEIGDEQCDHEHVSHRPLGDGFDEVDGAAPPVGVAHERRPCHQCRFSQRHDDAEQENERRRYRTPDLVQPSHGSEDAARLRVDLHFADAFLERRGDLRRQLVDDDLPQIAPRGFEKSHD